MMSLTRCPFLLLICILAAGCRDRAPGDSLTAHRGAASEELYQGKISIGAVKWPGYTCLYVAEHAGFFEREGLDVEIKIYPGTSTLSKDYLAGRMQGRANLMLEVVQEQMRGKRHKVVAAIDFSNGADAIMAGHDIESVSQFKGKRVAVENDSLGEFFLLWALEEYGLTIDDIILVDVGDSKESAMALKEGRADASVTYEPEVSWLEGTGDFHRVYTSADAPGLITDVLTFDEQFVTRHPASIEAILRAYFKAYRFWQENPGIANAHVARVLDTKPEEIPDQQAGANILSFRENRDAFSFGSGLTSLYGNMRRTYEFVYENIAGKPPLELVATDQLIEPRFIRKLAPEFEQSAP